MAQCNVTAAERRYMQGGFRVESRPIEPPLLPGGRRGGCDADGVMRVAAERPYSRPPQRHADREAWRDCVLAAELVTAKLITVQLLKVSRRE
jgi:hypothetical protein